MLHFLPSEECRNKPDVIFKQNTPVVRCAHTATAWPLLHASADTYKLPLRQFLVFLSELLKSQQLRVERFIMTSTDVCVILELCLEFLKRRYLINNKTEQRDFALKGFYIKTLSSSLCHKELIYS